MSDNDDDAAMSDDDDDATMSDDDDVACDSETGGEEGIVMAPVFETE